MSAVEFDQLAGREERPRLGEANDTLPCEPRVGETPSSLLDVVGVPPPALPLESVFGVPCPSGAVVENQHG